MKKILLSALFVLPLSVFAFSADYDPGVWIYQFHLQIKNGVVQTQTGSLPYDASPAVALPEPISPANTDFRIDITSGRGVLLGSFGFNDPKTIVPALQASVFDIETPFFANGGKATVFNKEGKKLLEISLVGSSFCNDNGKCEGSVGETYMNCANDCPPPVTPDSPPPVPTADPTTPPPTPPGVTSTPAAPDTVTSVQGDGTVTHSPGTPVEKKSIVLPMTLGVGIVLIALVGLIYWRRRGVE